MERACSNAFASTSAVRFSAATALRTASPRLRRFSRHVMASSLDDMAEKQVTKMKLNKVAQKEVEALKNILPDYKTDENLLASPDDAMAQQWANADANSAWEGTDDGGALGQALGGLQSLPMGEIDIGDPGMAATPDGLPSYRSTAAAAGGRRPYGSMPPPLPTPVPVRDDATVPPAVLALEELLMQEAVEEGMWLHHERLETAQNRFAVSLAFSELLEEVERNDVMRGVAPLVPGTEQKMPSWIRASEALHPHLDALNASQKELEDEANDAEVERVRASIMEDVETAMQLLAVTDPAASVRIEMEAEATEDAELADLFGGASDLALPGLEPETGPFSSVEFEGGIPTEPGAMFKSQGFADVMGEGGKAVTMSALESLEQNMDMAILEGALEDDEEDFV